MYSQYQNLTNSTTSNTTFLNCVYSYPLFTSNLILEFHQENATQLVKLRYNGQYFNLCDNPTK
jgi:hypothetical protein